MTQFAGYLLFDGPAGTGTDPRSAVLEQRIRRSMQRASPLPVQTARRGAFAVMVQPLGLPGMHRLRDDADGGVVAVAGDPIACADAQAMPDPRARIAFEAALLGGEIAGLRLARGTFAAVGYNPRGGTLLLVTDAVGSRCLYVRTESDRLLFATRLATLRSMSAEPEALDERGIAESLFFGQCLGSRTPFSGIQVLQPGSARGLRPGSDRSLVDFARPASTESIDCGLDEAIDRVHAAFSTAVERRLVGGSQDAFLSGGMDSRVVVASLVDRGRRVRTFCTSFEGSADDVVGDAIAAHLGTEHYRWHRSPADRVRTSMDPFAAYAHDHFPADEAPGPQARRIWSGDGGSVTIGHVYLRAQDVDRLASKQAPDEADVRAIFPALTRRPTRQVSAARMRTYVEAATHGALEELRLAWGARPDRRLFRFYMRNDQARHLHLHFEDIDLTQIELLTPFFDADLQTVVAALPAGLFLRHRLYNEWIKRFGCSPGSVFWQPYPGHLPGPHPAPPVKADQWDKSWFATSGVRRAYRDLGRQAMAQVPPLARPLVSASILRLAALFNRAGTSRFDYELAHAWRVVNLLRRAD